MKKIISVLLAIALMATLSVTAFAAEAKTDNVEAVSSSVTSKVDVKIDGNSTENIDKVYFVEVKWDSLDFTYSFDKTADNKWNPQSHTYSEAEGATGNNWDKTSANITVTNHSNEAVAISAAIDTETKNGVTATLSNASFNLATGVGLTYDTADSEVIGVAIAGVPTIEEGFTIGTITVTVSAV